VATVKDRKEIPINRKDNHGKESDNSRSAEKSAPQEMERNVDDKLGAKEDESIAPQEQSTVEVTGESTEAETELGEPKADPIVAERDKLKDQLLRVAADFDNFRKRTRRDIEDVKVRAREDILRELLPIFDNLKRAISASNEAQNTESIIEGVQMVLKLFEDIGERLGLKRVDAMGQRFDPALHDALQQIETIEHPAGTIIAEIAPGYLFGGHLLRAAMVVVARQPKKEQKEESVKGTTPEANSDAAFNDDSSAGNSSDSSSAGEPKKD
jgi:molecular chaperone GrpE